MNNNNPNTYPNTLRNEHYRVYEQKGGDMIRVDMLNYKKITSTSDFKNYNILESSDSYKPNQEITTYYLHPKYKSEQINSITSLTFFSNFKAINQKVSLSTLDKHNSILSHMNNYNC